MDKDLFSEVGVSCMEEVLPLREQIKLQGTFPDSSPWRRGAVQIYMDADTSSVRFSAVHPRKMLANFEPYLVPGRQFMLLSRAGDDLSAAWEGKCSFLLPG